MSCSTCPGTNCVKLLAMAMIGLSKLRSVIPVARQRARAPAMLRPEVEVRLRISARRDRAPVSFERGAAGGYGRRAGVLEHQPDLQRQVWDDSVACAHAGSACVAETGSSTTSHVFSQPALAGRVARASEAATARLQTTLRIAASVPARVHGRTVPPARSSACLHPGVGSPAWRRQNEHWQARKGGRLGASDILPNVPPLRIWNAPVKAERLQVLRS
jgi:hypothetical protein